MYPVKDPGVRAQVYSKYRCLILGDPKQIRLVRNYWYFVVLHLTVSLYSKNCK